MLLTKRRVYNYVKYIIELNSPLEAIRGCEQPIVCHESGIANVNSFLEERNMPRPVARFCHLIETINTATST